MPTLSRLCVLALSCTLCFVLSSHAWAKRAGPAPVTPVTHNGVKYVAPNEDGRMGMIEAHDAATDAKLWDLAVYTVKINPKLEEDVQWTFVTQLALRDDNLLVTNEKGEHFTVNLKTRKVKK